MKLLIVKLSAFGDIIHALPALNDLLARPEISEVHWLLDRRYAFVGEIFPPEVHVHQVDLRGQHPLRSAYQAIRQLRREHFDVVLDLQGLIKSAVMAALIHPRVYGMDVRHLREKTSRLLLHPVTFHADEQHVVQQYRRVAAAPFIQMPLDDVSNPLAYIAPRIPTVPTQETSIEILFKHWNIDAKNYVWMHLGGGWSTKQLPQATWRKIADGVLAAGLTPILGWGNEQEQQLAAGVKQSVAAALLPEQRLNMIPLCAVLSHAAAVVGPDTGVVHLAAALGAPTVSFWGPSASWRSAPLGEKDRHIESNPHCGPCFKRDCDAFICMDMIKADDILAAIDDVYSTP
ncbi:MAG: glycosyltransferase family 9 protein [Mariprofundaceae bacterium]